MFRRRLELERRCLWRLPLKAGTERASRTNRPGRKRPVSVPLPSREPVESDQGDDWAEF
jgi:hypothetical protein